MKRIRLTLRKKILLSVCVTFIAAGVTLFVGSNRILMDGFLTLEHDTVLTDVQRVENALEESLFAIQTFAGDWAGWSDTRDFVLGQRDSYIEENLMDQAFVNAKISFMAFLDVSGQVVHMKSINLEEGAEVPNLDTLKHAIVQEALTKHSGPRDLKHGILMLAEGPMLVAAGPITNNDFELPISGTFIAGRFLDENELEALGTRTQLALSLARLDEANLAPDVLEAKEMFPRESARAVLPLDSKSIAGYAKIKDIAQKPALILRIEEPRAILQQGKRTVHLFTGVLFVAGLITFSILVFVLDWAVLRPLAKLHAHILRIRDSKDLSARVEIRSRDELGALANAFNETSAGLEQAQTDLEAMHRKLLEIARQAGMADVASGVLHNVGNVLNSVNVATSTIRQQVRGMRIENLMRATDMMKEHAGDLASFLSQDARGSKLPEYLIRLSQQLKEEQSGLDVRLGELDAHVQHIAEIISLQQSMAKKIGLIECVSLDEIVENAIKINDAALSRHGVTLERNFARLPKIRVDRHQLLQILVNLISNAKYALRDGVEPEKRIILTVEGPRDDRVRVSVTDNGAGIAAENLERIFAHGFTTRADGHGFGLHTAAIAAKQLDGALSVVSDGLGKGATFTLELPFREVLE